MRRIAVLFFASLLGCASQTKTPLRVPAPSARPTRAVVPHAAAADGGEMLRPCTPHSPRHDEAVALTEALSKRIAALPEDGDATAPIADLERLLKHPCLKLAELEAPYESFDG